MAYKYNVKNNNKNKKKDKINNRLAIIYAIIFLLFLSLIFKMYKVQIINHDYYSLLASKQHRLEIKLDSERGDILFYDNGSKGLFPLATNKDFASVFFIPKDAVNRDFLANKVFLAFDKKDIIEEVQEEFKKEKENKLNNELNYIKNLDISEEEKAEKRKQARNNIEYLTAEEKELEEIKINLEIENRKEDILDKYMYKLNKRNDPYEPLKEKVSEEEFLLLFSYLISKTDEPIPLDRLNIDNFRVSFVGDFSDLSLADDLDISNPDDLSYPGISYHLKKYRYYPEKEIASNILGFVSTQGDKNVANYGLEEFFDIELSGEEGFLETNRGSGNSVNVNDRRYQESKDGADIVLTLDRSAQFAVCEKLKEGIEKYEADSGSVIVIDPSTGAIIAMCSFPTFDPNNYSKVNDIQVYNNPITFYQYEPGSVFKSITLAIAIDQDKINPNTLYEDKGQIMIEGWPYPIKNADFSSHGPHGLVDMNTVLSESLNTGSIFAANQVDPKIFSNYIEKFGFGQKAGIELGSETAGDIDNLLNKKIKKIDIATASFGQGIAVSPLQMAMSYAVIANDGVLMKPYLVKEIKYSDGRVDITQPRTIRQVISQKSAKLVSGMLVNVIEGGHAIKAKVPGYYLGGKTGTAQIADKGGYSEDEFIHSFIGIVPIDKPKFVISVKLDNPKAVRYGADSAAPLFSEISDFLLKYYQIPEER